MATLADVSAPGVANPFGSGEGHGPPPAAADAPPPRRPSVNPFSPEYEGEQPAVLSPSAPNPFDSVSEFSEVGDVTPSGRAVAEAEPERGAY